MQPDPQPDCCPLCRQSNSCQLGAETSYKGPCWCFAVDIPDQLLARIPQELRNRACICRNCVESFAAAEAKGPAAAIQAGDFYFDGLGLMVLTKQYHLRRGYCCDNGCCHCPYGDRPQEPKA